MKIIEEQEKKIADFKCIVDELEHNIGYAKLLEFWRDEVKTLDDTWQFIPEEDGKRRMEARATKMAYMHLLNILDYLKADIENTKKVVAELKSEELS